MRDPMLPNAIYWKPGVGAFREMSVRDWRDAFTEGLDYEAGLCSTPATKDLN